MSIWEEPYDFSQPLTCSKETLVKRIQYLEKELEQAKAQQQVKVEPEVKPVYGHKRTAKQFFIEQYQEGKCEDITTNPYPEFNNAFYLNIYKLMEDYSKSV